MHQELLMGIVSHDLRNPLGAMVTAASMLKRCQGVDENLLNRLTTSGERATRLIRDLLDFTQARHCGGLPIARTQTDVHEGG